MFGKKPKKLDSHVRFQHQNFTRKLDAQRHYKRQASALPEYESRNFLHKLGLKTLFSQIVLLLILAGLIYLIYIPNFLFVKSITVQGVSGEEGNLVKADINNYFNHTPFFNPQRNIIFLSQDKVKQALLNNPRIYAVDSVKKSLFHRTLTVVIKPKIETYLLNHNSFFYTLNNDGTIAGQANIDSAQWLAALPSLIKIKDNSLANIAIGEKYLDDETLTALQDTKDNFVSQVMAELDYIEIPSVLPVLQAVDTATATATFTPSVEVLPLHPGSIHIVAKKGIANYKGPVPNFKVIVDTTQNLHNVFERLHLLMTQTSSDRFRNLVYVDMRFENKSFLCLLGALCDQTVVSPPTPVVAPKPN